MTDKLNSLTVILEKPVRDDDVGELISAIVSAPSRCETCDKTSMSMVGWK